MTALQVVDGHAPPRSDAPTKTLLICGILAAAVYVGTDLLATTLYPGYSFRAQAVSELFAIGAATSPLVVPLFSLSSVLLLAFAVGVWRVAGDKRVLRAMALMFGWNAVNALVLWNLFPMHMRGATPTFTDTMHLILAANPFVLLSLLVAVVAFKHWFRLYSIVTILIVVGLAVVAFSYAPQLAANESTPWLGLTERAAQYAYDVWQVILATLLLRGTW